MIYTFPSASEEIKQGDIFMNIPCVELGSLDALAVFEEGGEPDTLTSLTWDEVVGDSDEGVTAAIGIYPVPAIVITQSCDAAAKNYITLCEITKLSEVGAFRNYETKNLKNRTKLLIDNNRKMPGIFYLAPDRTIGFTDKMVVVFSNTIRVRREELERFRDNRRGRLDKIASEHFREKLAHFFRRYAFNEWYILSKEELESQDEYRSLDPTKLYDHQK